MINNIFEINGFILGIDYIFDENQNSKIRIIVKDNNKVYEIFDKEFTPYFYYQLNNNELIKNYEEYFKSILIEEDFNKIIKIENQIKELFGEKINILKLFTNNTSNVSYLRQILQNYGICYEADIPFAKRYLIDKNIIPYSLYSLSIFEENNKLFLKSMENQKIDIAVNNFNTLCFDIETYNKSGNSIPKKDPVLMISYSYYSENKKIQKVITYKKVEKKYVEYVEDEKKMFQYFISIINELNVDIIIGYNSSNFDIKYMIERAKVLGIDFNLSRFGGKIKVERHGFTDKIKMSGRIHIDMYYVIRFIAIVSASTDILKLNSFTLKNVYESITNEKKINVEKKQIYSMWDGTQKDLEQLTEYNLSDSISLNKIFDVFFPLILELSRTSGETLDNVSVSTTGQLVEFLLMKYAYQFNNIIPNRPNETEIRIRLSNPIEGAYVKTPEPGIYNNIVIFDFRSLYPSVIISYNIDPSAICNNKECSDYYESPTNTKFDKNKKAIIPIIVNELVKQRIDIKKMYKKNQDSIILGARSQALKIIANSFYGYLGYARSRWYSRECAASVTAYSREYIKNTIKTAEESEFEVLYADTDSIFLLMNEKTKKDINDFSKQINKMLPKSMDLELEDFYTRGIFVSKKSKKEKLGAKKKYALISESGKIKIKGFELVRRDWSNIARSTQQTVLETILKNGSIDEVLTIIKDIINKIRSGNIDLKYLVINTHLRKSIDNYDLISPEVAAARKAVKLGFKTKQEINNGNIGYIITKKGDSISDKAMLEGIATDYDPDYYINNQIIPAVMKILKEMNITEQQIKHLGTQKKL